MNAITVCVEYDDLLALTLPRAATHFERVLVVTSFDDARTADVVARTPNAECFQTDLFFADGANFNKGRALEAGFDVLGREGLICVFDADIVMPPCLERPPLLADYLYSPYRRMCRNPLQWDGSDDWSAFPRFSDNEFAGYFQLFHAMASALESRPWYGVDWNHAGGCDSDFQAKWPTGKKRRLPFDVLHLGDDCTNWHGRCSQRLDGTMPDKADERRAAMRQMRRSRQTHGYTKEHINALTGTIGWE